VKTVEAGSDPARQWTASPATLPQAATESKHGDGEAPMRLAYPLAVLVIVLTTAFAMAQEAQPTAPPPAAGDWNGPVVGGRHRQPTQSEVQSRQQADGQSAQAIQQRNRDEDKTIDDLYKELMTPVPSGERSGAPGQTPR
jgi:hypothetical protein